MEPKQRGAGKHGRHYRTEQPSAAEKPQRPKIQQPVKKQPAPAKPQQPVKKQPAPAKPQQPVKKQPAPAKPQQPVKKQPAQATQQAVKKQPAPAKPQQPQIKKPLVKPQATQPAPQRESATPAPVKVRHTRVKEHPEDASIRETLRAFFSKVGGFFRDLYVLRAVKIICLILALTLTAGLLQEFILCHADHNRQRLKGFYLEDKDSLDVVFMGASEVYSDFSPGHAFDKYKLTSYLFSTQSNSILNYKAQLENILSRQNPDLIVIELNGALYADDGETTKESNLRNYADNVPLDGIKMEWIAENGGDNALEYVFPLIKYHGVWKDIPDGMLYQDTVIENKVTGYSYLKGILNEAAVFQPTQTSMNSMLKKSAGSKQPLGGPEEEALRDLLHYCKSHHLSNVVFARFPHIVVRRTFSRFERSNTVADIVHEYGFDYINFELNYDQTGLDEATDFYNLDHLNVYGQKKFTEFFSEYLMENYDVAPRVLTEPQKKKWRTCADYYKAYYTYSDELIQNGNGRELSEDSDLLWILRDYLP